MHGYNGPPVGNHICRVEWSRDRWRHVTPKSQSLDPIIFEAASLSFYRSIFQCPSKMISAVLDVW